MPCPVPSQQLPRTILFAFPGVGVCLHQGQILGEKMPKLKILVSLTTNDNDYQAEQAISAEQAARKFGVDVQILYADNDAINQSTQILKAIQAAEADRPDAIVF